MNELNKVREQLQGAELFSPAVTVVELQQHREHEPAGWFGIGGERERDRASRAQH